MNLECSSQTGLQCSFRNVKGQVSYTLVNDCVSHAIQIVSPRRLCLRTEELARRHAGRRGLGLGCPIDLNEPPLERVEASSWRKLGFDIRRCDTSTRQDSSEDSRNLYFERRLSVEYGERPLESLQSPNGVEHQMVKKVQLVLGTDQPRKQVEVLLRQSTSENEVIVAIGANSVNTVDAEGSSKVQLIQPEEHVLR